ncbi:MAG: molybdenum cofactor guanylyltransferase [Nannocystaceae bacterium]|nr:molybdenum cofactor guanylyltransferase [Nannocystaceae bacterium]
MGRPKATLPWRGKTMLEAVLHPLQACCEFVVVVAHPGQVLPALPAGVLRVDDPPELDDQGPLVGVYAGLSALDADDAVYLAATDKPSLSARHVDWMFERLGDADAAVPVDPPDSLRRHRMHPLAGVLRVGAAREAIALLLREDERALRLTFERLRCNEVPVSTLPDPNVLRDCNTPADYQAALQGQES